MKHDCCWRPHGSRSGSVRYISCLLLAGALVLGGCRYARPAPNTPASSGNRAGDLPESAVYPDSFLWQKAVFQGQQLVQVGPRLLPVPLTFPSGMTPLGGKALVMTWPKPNPKLFACMLIYSPTQEGRLRAWMEAFPKNFPIAPGHYRIVEPPVSHVYPNKNWLSVAVVSTSACIMDFSGHHEFPEHGAIVPDTGTDLSDLSGRAMIKAFEAPESPIPRIGPYASMTITFVRKVARDKTIPVLTYRWEALHWRGRAIRAVGATTLPVPIILPSWMHPLGDKALTTDTTAFDNHAGLKGYKSAHQIDLWLPDSQAHRLWQWLNGFPTNFMVSGARTPPSQWPKVRYYHDPYLLGPRHSQDEWGYWFMFGLPGNGRLDLQTNGMDVPPQKDGPGMSFLPGLGAALLSPASPIRHEKSVIDFDLRFITLR